MKTHYPGSARQLITVYCRRSLSVVLFVHAVAACVAQDRILPVDPASSTTPRASTRQFEWNPALRQSLTFFTIQQGFRIATQESTRSELKGPYLRDWLTSVGNLRGWDDGDGEMANYVGHPMEGAIAGYIHVQNDRRSMRLEFGHDNEYWKSRLRALMWSSIYSTNYELGPLGDGAIGNVGKTTGTKGVVDLVITPTCGIAWMVTEDAVDKYVIAWLERRWHHPTARLMVRSWLNPSRSMANVLRGRWPWYRDTRGGVGD
jgi:hypothetical protein